MQVMGKPSAELAGKMSAEEKERVAKQQRTLGENGLKEKGEKLEKAITQNEVSMGQYMTDYKYMYIKDVW